MATTSPDNIWTPDSGDDYALTVDLAATADTVQDALTSLRAELNAQPLVQRGVATVVGNTEVYAQASVTFPVPFPPGSASDIQIVSSGALAGSITNNFVMSSDTIDVTETGFTLRLKVSSGTFSATYQIPWIAVGPRS